MVQKKTAEGVQMAPKKITNANTESNKLSSNDQEMLVDVVSKDEKRELYPYYFCGTVIFGFGRGGRQLGCPTANLDDKAVSCLPAEFPCGVFYGFARVDSGEAYGMVTSVGWNPHFKNKRKTIEVHILHRFDNDFYGSKICAVVIGFLRPMTSFNSLEDLKYAIKEDITIARSLLSKSDNVKYKEAICSRQFA